MTTPIIDAAARKRAMCPFCQEPMDYKGDGRYDCPNGCGEFLRRDPDDESPQRKEPQRERLTWPELVEGTTGSMREAMRAVSSLPLGTADVVGPCQGHGGKRGGGKSKGGKSPARQKLDAWQRKMGPGRLIRSIR